jgi:RNA polymerase sigma factor (sigma-70 family)
VANTHRESALRHLCQLLGPPAAGETSDGQLLGRFVADQEEAAFAALLRRHGSLVWYVCRRVLGSVQDAEDAFQATFLLLARKAASIRKHEAVASWLYGTAYRLAKRVKLQNSRRQARERQVGDMPTREPALEAAWRELQTLLDDELHQLPEKYRAPLVLCYLEGKTHEQAAQQLGWPLGTVRGRVARARELLRSRLTRRGLTLSAGAFATVLAAGTATAAVPARLLEPTLRAALQFAGGPVSAAGLVTTQAAALAEGGLQAMFVTKLKVATALLLAVTVLASGVGALTYSALADKIAEVKQRNQALPPVEPAREPGRAGQPGEALPPGALARLGSDRLRQTGTFYCLTFSPDGKVLACAQMDSTIRLLEVPSGKEIRQLGQPHNPDPAMRNYWVSWMTFSPDGRLLAVLKPGKGVSVWKTDPGAEVCQLDVDLQYEVASLAFSPDGKLLATGGVRQPVRLWDAATGKELRRLEGHQGRAGTVAFSPDGKTLVSGSDDQTVRLWDVETGKELRQFVGHRNAVQALGFSADGKTLTSAGIDRTVRLWEAATGKELHRLDAGRIAPLPQQGSSRVINLKDTLMVAPSQPSAGVIIFVAVAVDGKTVALGRSDRTVRFWETDTGHEQTRFEGQPGPATNLALSPDGRVVAMGNVGGRIHFWDRITGKELASAEGHQYPVHAAAFSPDGRLLASGSADRTIRLWETATGKELRQIHGHIGEVSALAFAPDGKTLASVSRDPNDRTVSLWEVATGQELRQFRYLPAGDLPRGRSGGGGFGDAPGLSPNGGFGGASGLEGLGGSSYTTGATTATGAVKGSPGATVAAYLSLAFSPDGKTLALLDLGGSVWLWEVDSGRAMRTLPVRGLSLAFSADSKHVIALGADGMVRLYDVSSGQEIRSHDSRPAGDPNSRSAGDPNSRFVADRPRTILSVGACFSSDSRTFVLANGDGSLRLWDVATGKPLHKVGEWSEAQANSGRGGSGGTAGFGGTAGMSAQATGRFLAAFSPDGRTLAVLGKGNSVRLLEVATGKERCRFDGHQGEVAALVFSPDGKTLATGSLDTTALLWNVTSCGKVLAKEERTAERAKALWVDLAEADGVKAYQAICTLAASHGMSVPWLAEQLRPAALTDTKRIPQLIADLDSDDFATRTRAVEDLEKLGTAAQPALLKVLAAKPSLELNKRVEGILKKLEDKVPSGDELRDLRAVEVLERIGSGEARQVLEKLAQGAPEARLTLEAAAALERLRRR